MVIPLKAKQGVLGTIAFVSSDPYHPFADSDLRFAQELAWHVAIAIENARLDDKARSKDILVRKDLPTDEGLLVSCDYERAIQVLANLAGNAVKFTPRGGEVTLGGRESGSEARFWVADNGPYIARKMVDAHHGWI